MALPTVSDREAERLLEDVKATYESHRDALRTAEAAFRESVEGTGNLAAYNPVIWDEWEQIRSDEYRKQVDAIQELRRRLRGADINIRQADAPWPIVYGRVRTGGVYTFASDESDTGGDWVHFGYTLAGHEIANVQKVFVNGEEVEWDTTLSTCSTTAAGAAGSKWEGLIEISLRTLGGHTEGNSDLVAASLSHFQGKWASNHVQQGRAFVYIKIKFDNELFAAGNPVIEFEIEGNNQIYDPRDDSTGYSANAALIIAHHLTNSVYGMGKTWATVIDETDLETQADIADEAVELANGGTDARYEMNGILYTDQTRRTQLAQLVTAIGGSVSFPGGRTLIKCAAWPSTAGDLSLDENDLLGGLQVELMPGASSRFNGVRGRYVSAADGYTLKEFPPVRNSYYLARDRGVESWLDIVLPCTTSAAAAQRLAKIELERIRQGTHVRATFALKAFQARVGDVIALTNAHFGWAAKLFEVVFVQLTLGGTGDPAFTVSLELQETASGVFDWNSGLETTQDLAPNTNLPSVRVVAKPTDIALDSGTSHLYVNPDGTIFSRLYVSWTAPRDAYVKNGGAIDVQYKKSSASTWTPQTSVSGSSAHAYILDVADGELYDVRIRARNILGAVSEWLVANSHRVLGKTAAPSDVLGLTATIEDSGVLARWKGISDVDLEYYIVKTGSDWASAVAIAEIRSDSFRWSNQVAGEYTLLVKAVDSSGNESENIASVTFTIRAPAAPVVSAELVDAEVLLSWGDVETTYSIAEYVVSYGAAAGENVLGRVKGTTYRVRVSWAGERRFWVAGVDLAGNVGAGGSRVVEIVAPGRPLNLSAEVQDNNVLLRWNASLGTLPISFYRVRRGAELQSAELVGTVAGTFTLIVEFLADAYTYQVSAVDTAGNEGAAAPVLAVVSQPPDFVLRSEGSILPQHTKRSGILAGQSGVRRTAAFVSADSTYLSAADADAFSAGAGDLTLVVRFRPTLDSAQHAILSKWTADTAAGGEYEIGIDAANKLYFRFVGGTTATVLTAAAALTTAEWVTAVCRYDAAAQEITAEYSGVARYDAAHTAGANNSTATLMLGRSGGGTPYHFDGELSFAGVWKGAVGVATLAQLVDMDSGLSVEALDAELLLNCRAAWNLDEYSAGTAAVSREDGVGPYDLTDNGTVASSIQTDPSRTVELAPGDFYAPVVIGETWAEHFTDNSMTTIDGFIAAGFSFFLEPSDTTAAYIEQVIDFGATIASGIIQASLIEESIGQPVEHTISLASSSDGATFSDYVEANSIYGTLVKAIKIKFEFTGRNTRSLSLYRSPKYRIDVKRTNDDGEITAAASDNYGTPAPFNKAFLDVESITFDALSIIRAASFQGANEEYLGCPHNSALSWASTDSTITLWARLANNRSDQIILSKWDAPDDCEYRLRLASYGDGDVRFVLEASSDGVNATSVSEEKLKVPITNQWYLIAIQHDYTNGYLRIKINDFAISETAFAGNVHAGTSEFMLGTDPAADLANFYSGLLRNVAKWDRCLTSPELDTLYHMGVCGYAELSNERPVSVFDSTSDQFLSTPDAASLSVTGNFTFAAWVRFDTKPSSGWVPVASKWEHIAGDASFALRLSCYSASLAYMYIVVTPDGASTTSVISNKIIEAGKWYFVCGRYDGAALKIRVNDYNDSEPYSSGMQDSAVDLILGWEEGLAGDPYFDGKMCCAGIWARALSDADLDFMFNNGRPIAYEYLTAAAKEDLSAYWNLDEAEGLRLDMHGGHDFLDNNGVSGASDEISRYADGTLSAFWQLDEASGARADSVGSNDLSDYGTVPSRVLDITPGFNFEDIPNPRIFYGLLFNAGTRISGGATWKARGFINPLGRALELPWYELQDASGESITDASGGAMGVY